MIDTREGALRCARRLAAIPGGGALRRLAAMRALAQRTPEEGAQLLHDLLAASRDGAPEVRVALTALLSSLGEEGAALGEPLLHAAQAAGFAEVAALFTAAPPTQALDPDRGRPSAEKPLDLSLGHLTWKARRTRSRDELHRLALASEPSVIRNLLMNPRVTEETVVGIAARRPGRPEVLQEVWRSPRWGVRRGVRRALAFNPYLPPAVGTRIVPLLTLPDWRELAGDSGLSFEVREQAQRLLHQARASGERSDGGDASADGPALAPVASPGLRNE